MIYNDISKPNYILSFENYNYNYNLVKFQHSNLFIIILIY